MYRYIMGKKLEGAGLEKISINFPRDLSNNILDLPLEGF